MRCPFCYHEDTRVIDSRPSAEGPESGIRRRRECLAAGCERRFTTYERVQLSGAFVIKKDGRREEFSREKLLAGVRRACEKRPLSASALETLADYVEAAVTSQAVAEVPSSYIGELVMGRLRALDDIAYIRFASVYRSFQDVDELKEELSALESHVAVGRHTPPAANQLPLLGQEQLKSLAGKEGPAVRLVRGRTDRPASPPETRRRARG